MAALTARPYKSVLVRTPHAFGIVSTVLAWLVLALVLIVLAFVAISQVLDWRLANIDEQIAGAPARNSLGVFEGVPSHGLYRGDVVLYRDEEGTKTVRRISALAADGSFVLEGPNGAESALGAPGDFRGLYLFAIPFAGPAGAWAASPAGVGVLAAAAVVLVIMLSTRRILAPKRAGLGHSAYLGNVRRRIVSYSRATDEDAIVKFPLRRHRPTHTAEASTSPTVQRLTEAVHAVEATTRPDPIELRPPGFHLAAETTPDEAAAPGLRLRSQYSAADARTDRLVRQMREEVADLRESVGQRPAAPALEPDVTAILADPEAAAEGPPAHLVRALLVANERHAELLTALADERKRASKLKAKLRKRRTEQAVTGARLETLQDVIAALHGNLEDLRLERDHGYHLGPAARNGIDQVSTHTRFPVLPGNE